MKFKNVRSECRFCNDDEFAQRHIMEDELLNDIASLAADLVNEWSAQTGRLAGGRLSSHAITTIEKISEALVRFKSLDTELDQAKRAVRDLKAIERDLSSPT